jgi:hypothetical protein
MTAPKASSRAGGTSALGPAFASGPVGNRARAEHHDKESQRRKRLPSAGSLSDTFLTLLDRPDGSLILSLSAHFFDFVRNLFRIDLDEARERFIQLRNE